MSSKKYIKLSFLILALVSLAGSVIAFYHFGIEQGFFSESIVCETKNLGKNRFELSSGPYRSINTLKNDYFALNKYGFEDLDIKQND